MFKVIICHQEHKEIWIHIRIDFHYPEETHQRNNDLPPGPETMKIKEFHLSVMLIMKEKYLRRN